MEKVAYKEEWDLSKYFYTSINDPKIQSDIKLYKETVLEFIEYFKTNTMSNADDDLLLEYYKMNDKIKSIIYPVYLYYSYISSLDTQDQDIIKREADLSNIASDLSTKSLFINDDFKKLGYTKLIKLSKSPKLKGHKNSIIQSANDLKYILSKNKEEVIIEKDKSGCNVLDSLYSELTNSFTFNFRGEVLTPSEVYSKRGDLDGSVR